jgi:hypothetical protein
MIKVAINKNLLSNEGQKAAFAIVKNTVERSLKQFEKEIAKENGSVVVTITGPGAFDISMDKLSLKLRRKIASAAKKMLSPYLAGLAPPKRPREGDAGGAQQPKTV